MSHVRKQKRVESLLAVNLTFLCQYILCIMIFMQLTHGDFNRIAFVTMIQHSYVNFGRWICAFILHLMISDGIIGSLERMKYTLNHPYKFHLPAKAFFLSFEELFILITVEICNLMIILAQTTPIDIVINFIVVAIIAEFDEFVYASLRNEHCKLLVEKKIAERVLVIHHTTSGRCGVDELSDVKDEDGNFRRLRI